MENVYVSCLDTGMTEIISGEQADVLEASGMIRKETWGYVSDVQEVLREAIDADTEAMKCDFCGSPDVTFLHPCEDFLLMKTRDGDHMSRGSWAACNICNHLIEQELWDDLAQRAFSSYDSVEKVASPLAAAFVMEVVKPGLRKFREHRTGPGVPVGTEVKNG